MPTFVITRANKGMLAVSERMTERIIRELSHCDHGDLQTFRKVSGVSNIVSPIVESESR